VLKPLSIKGWKLYCLFIRNYMVYITRAMELAVRFKRNFEEAIGITVSIGVAHSEELDVNEGKGGIDELIKLADKRMYQAKLQGKNQVC